MPSSNEPFSKVKQGWITVKQWINTVNEKPAGRIYTFVRIAIAVILLYFCIFALQFTGQAPQTFSQGEDEGLNMATPIQLDDATNALLDAPLASSQVTISGQTDPFSTVQLLILEKVIASTSSDENGNFVIENISLPPWTTAVEIKAIDSQQTQKTASIVRWILWEETAFIPEIELAIYIPEMESLWIAGSAAPSAQLKIKTGTGDPLVNKLTANGLGIFEAFVPIFEELPEEITPELFNSNLPPSGIYYVTTIPLDELPLARVVDVNMGAEQTSFNFQVTLPVVHPYFRAIAAGTLPPNVFASFSFGAFSYYRETSDIIFGTGFRELRLQWEQPLFTFEGQTGKVEVRGIIDDTLTGISFDNLSPDGIGRWPFLTEQDRLTIHFHEFKPEWFGELYPNDADTQRAIWIGPLDFGEDTDILQVKLSPPASTETASSEATPVPSRQPSGDEAEKLWDFIRNFKSRLKDTSPLLYTVWSVGVFSLPFLTLILIRKSKLIGDNLAWRWFISIAVILGVWRGWYLFYHCLVINGPGKWLYQVSMQYFGRWPFLIENSQGPAENLWSNASANTFWLLFVVFAVLIPLSFHAKGNAGDKNNGVSDAPKWDQKIWLTIRLTWAVLTVAAMREIYLQWDAYPIGESILLAETLFGIIMVVFVMLFLLSAGGLLGTVFGLALIAVVVRAAAHIGGLEAFYGYFVTGSQYTHSPPTIDELILAQIPWAWVQLTIGISGFFFSVWLLRQIFPALGKWNWTRWVLAAALVVSAILWSSIPVKFLLTVGAVTVSLAFGWFAVQAVLHLHPDATQKMAQHWPIYAIWLIVVVAIAWPIAKADSVLQFRDMFELVNILDSRLVHILFLALLVLMWMQAKKARRVFHSAAALSTGGYVFAAMMVNNYSTVMLLPLTFIVAWWIGKRWVFRPKSEIEEIKKLMGGNSERTSNEVRTFVSRALYHRRLNNYQSNLRKKMDKGDIEPDKYSQLLEKFKGMLRNEFELKPEKPNSEHDWASYHQQLSRYKNNLRKKLEKGEIESDKYMRDLKNYKEKHRDEFKPEGQPTAQPQESAYAFAVGYGDIHKNLVTSLLTGILLGLIPIGIAAYKDLPAILMKYPFPLAYIASFLIWAFAPWFIYAFFFGYYYPHLRGNSGLAKGLWMALWLTIPQLTLYLATLRQFAEMTDHLLLSLQIFVFFGVLGLLMDIRVLRDHDFRSRDIVTVHELPKLAAFGSSVLTALAPILSSILTGWLGSNIDKLPGLIEPFKALWGE